MTSSLLAQPKRRGPAKAKRAKKDRMLPRPSSVARLGQRSNRLGDLDLLAGALGSWYRCAPMRENIRLLSSAGTGYSYYTKKNKRTQTNKLEVKKYDPVVRKHVAFKEAKMPPHSK